MLLPLIITRYGSEPIEDLAELTNQRFTFHTSHLTSHINTIANEKNLLWVGTPRWAFHVQ